MEKYGNCIRSSNELEQIEFSQQTKIGFNVQFDTLKKKNNTNNNFR